MYSLILFLTLFCFELIKGSQHSGSGEEDFNSNDLDKHRSHHQDHSDKEQGDQTDDEEGIDCKCVVCDRQCQDIDQ